MIAAVKYSAGIACVFAAGVLLTAFFPVTPPGDNLKFPYRQAGLTDRQAAAHLLSRLTYGATPGQVDDVVKTGPEKWFAQQLLASLPDDSLKQALARFDALQLSNAEVEHVFPRNAQVLRMAIRDGVINKDSLDKSDKNSYRQLLQGYMQQHGLRPQQELFRQFISQKILRSAITQNQLQEVLTDFWFNHFNVSITKNDCAPFIPAYERDVIRPNVLGRFEDLLVATAKSPAMLFFLDNFSSSRADSSAGKPGNNRVQLMRAAQMKQPGDSMPAMAASLLQKPGKVQGLNENYAREVMELHTLGVDGGYSQQDVTQAARVLTGWTVYPSSSNGNAIISLVSRIGVDKMAQRGFVHDGDFLFVPNRHDRGEKTVLGRHFAAGGGYEEGQQLFHLLARHPSTASFITRKLAVRFVSDDPPQSLVNRMAKSFLDHDGDIRQVLVSMVTSPEFWSAAALREKTKSPFELAISTVRSLNASISQPYQLFNWISKMGQRIYYYQAPTGFPDKGQYWINTGALLNRMNFGLALASQRIPGVTVDLIALNSYHEPESAEAALAAYGKLLMPERDLAVTEKRLAPMLHDPSLVQKVDKAANQAAPAGSKNNEMPAMALAEQEGREQQGEGRQGTSLRGGIGKANMAQGPPKNAMLAQVVGIIIGSPEFQRR